MFSWHNNWILKMSSKKLGNMFSNSNIIFNITDPIILFGKILCCDEKDRQG